MHCVSLAALSSSFMERAGRSARRSRIHVPTASLMITIRRKLPLLISALLVATVSTVCWLAYRAVEGVLLESAGVRLEAATQQVAAMLEESAQRLGADARVRAEDRTIVAYLLRPSASTERDARAALEAMSNRTTRRAEVELRDATGRVTLAVGGSSRGDATPASSPDVVGPI